MASFIPEARNASAIAHGARSDRAARSERWRSFPNFYADVGPRPSWRHLLIRDDPVGEFEPGNAQCELQRGIDGGEYALKVCHVKICRRLVASGVWTWFDDAAERIAIPPS